MLSKKDQKKKKKGVHNTEQLTSLKEKGNALFTLPGEKKKKSTLPPSPHPPPPHTHTEKACNQPKKAKQDIARRGKQEQNKRTTKCNYLIAAVFT